MYVFLCVIWQQKKKLRIFISNTFYPAKHEAEVWFTAFFLLISVCLTFAGSRTTSVMSNKWIQIYISGQSFARPLIRSDIMTVHVIYEDHICLSNVYHVETNIPKCELKGLIDLLLIFF